MSVRTGKKSDKKSDDDVMDALEAYNFAEAVTSEWLKKCAMKPEALHFTYFDDEHDESDNDASDHEAPDEDEKEVAPAEVKEDWELEEASENESIPAFDQEPESEEEHGHGDEDESDDDDDDPTWPGFLDRVIFQFAEEFTITSCMMNKQERKVYTAFREEDDKPVVIIVAEDLDPKRKVKQVPREVRIMKKLRGHPNVGNILGWCSVDEKHYALVMDFYMNCDVITCSQGNLFLVSKIMKSILTGLAHIHHCKITHRDLAKDNILWNPVKEEAVIIDFDTSCFYRPQGYFRDVGRDKYDAPEKTAVIEIRRKLWESSRKKPKPKRRLKAYNEKADVYSLGVLFWMLINNRHHSPSPYKLKRWIKKVKERRKAKKYPELDLLVKMLSFNPDRRISPADALNHPFIVNSGTSEGQEYANYSEMRKYLLKMLDMQDKLDELFDGDKPDGDRKSGASSSSDDDDDGGARDSNDEEDEEDEDLAFSDDNVSSDSGPEVFKPAPAKTKEIMETMKTMKTMKTTDTAAAATDPDVTEPIVIDAVAPLGLTH